MKGGSEISPDPPGYHYTHDYYRTSQDGSIQHVRGYIATNPDGIEENNLSHKNDHGTNPSRIADPAITSDGYHGKVESSEPLFAGADAGRTKPDNRRK